MSGELFDNFEGSDVFTRRIDSQEATRAPGGAAAKDGWSPPGAGPQHHTVVMRPSGPQRGMAWLVAASGAARGRSFRLDAGGAVIGRDPSSCDIVVDDPTVSRQHAKVRGEMVDGRVRYHILDMGSRSGTRVDDVRIDRVRLDDGARISLGQTEFVFKQSSR